MATSMVLLWIDNPIDQDELRRKNNLARPFRYEKNNIDVPCTNQLGEVARRSY